MLFFYVFSFLMMKFNSLQKMKLFFQPLQNACLERLSGHASSEISQALVCGQDIQNPEMRWWFYCWGLTHVIVASSAQLQLLRNIASWLKPNSDALSILLLFLFVMGTGLQAPILRGALAILLVQISQRFCLGWTSFHIFFLSLALSLGIHPDWIHSWSWQLTVLCSSAQGIFLGLVKMKTPQQNFSNENKDQFPWTRGLTSLWQNLLMVFALNFFVLIFILPFSSVWDQWRWQTFLGQVSFGFILSMLLFPMGLLALFIPPLLGFQNELMKILLILSGKIPNEPQPGVFLWSPQILQTWIVFSVMIFWFVDHFPRPWVRFNSKIAATRSHGIWLAYLTSFIFATAFGPKAFSREQTQHDAGDGPKRFIVWNVGQGLWTSFIEQKKCLHFDMGGERFPQRILLDCRGRQNIIHLSHEDWDHISFIQKFSLAVPKTCFAPTLVPMKNTLKRILNALRVCETGNFQDSIHFQLPRKMTPSEIRSENEKSQIYEYSGVLLPGDSTKKMEENWSANVQTKIQGLVLGHHGSKTSSGQKLLDRLRFLQWAVASARWQKYHHPHPSVQLRLKQKKVPLLRTEQWGHLEFEL